MPSPRKKPPRVLRAVFGPPQEYRERTQWRLCEQAYIDDGDSDTRDAVTMPVIDGAAIGGRCTLWCVPQVQPDALKSSRGPIQRRGVAYDWACSDDATAQDRSPSQGSGAASDGEIFENQRLGLALERLMVERAEKDSPRISEGSLDDCSEFELGTVLGTSDHSPRHRAVSDDALKKLLHANSRRRHLLGADGPTVREPRAVELRRLQDIPTLPFGHKVDASGSLHAEGRAEGATFGKRRAARAPHTPRQGSHANVVLRKPTSIVTQSDDIEAVLRKMPMPKLEPMPDD